MDRFAEQLKAWELFFSTVALASVTLAGLLFVSLSLHLEALKGPRPNRLLRLARGSFGDFSYVPMLGLVFLVPHQAPFGLAIALFVLGAARGIGLFRQARQAEASRGMGATATSALREIALPALTAVGLVVVAVEIMLGAMVAIHGLVLVIAALLATASWNAWLILIEDEA